MVSWGKTFGICQRNFCRKNNGSGLCINSAMSKGPDCRNEGVNSLTEFPLDDPQPVISDVGVSLSGQQLQATVVSQHCSIGFFLKGRLLQVDENIGGDPDDDHHDWDTAYDETGQPEIQGCPLILTVEIVDYIDKASNQHEDNVDEGDSDPRQKVLVISMSQSIQKLGCWETPD